VSVPRRLGCERGFTTPNVDDVFVGVLLDLVGRLLAVGAEGFVEELAILLERLPAVAASLHDGMP